MEISIRQTSIRPKHVKHLLSHGIILITHLNTFNPTRLALKTGLPLEECKIILESTKPRRPHYKIKASDLMVSPFEKISTTIPELDAILDGGIRCGRLTEISGEAGSGKSNMCSQIGTLVMLPVYQGGTSSDVLLIHTEGEGKLKLAIKRFKTLLKSENQEELMETKLHVMNCQSENHEIELEEMINRLPGILDEKKTVKLVIIDSLTSAFMATEGAIDFKFYIKRGIKLTRICKKLAQLAWDRRISVIITNHVTYNCKLGENKPALGKIWSSMCQTKIYLERKNIAKAERCAYVTKGAFYSPTVINFKITNELDCNK